MENPRSSELKEESYLKFILDESGVKRMEEEIFKPLLGEKRPIRERLREYLTEFSVRYPQVVRAFSALYTIFN